ncbi:MAG: hypothetical protein CM15mP106_3490 [Candidatus Neomarinimicrobiota bacterium]|nr:MAG: hypothetical protein CM15mP106_3490 [Candidatus Neomarinimicrobiota bacterium]
MKHTFKFFQNVKNTVRSPFKFGSPIFFFLIMDAKRTYLFKNKKRNKLIKNKNKESVQK